MKALLLSGGGDYIDSWHPFAQTSAAAAAVLQGAGFDVEIRDDVERAVAVPDAAVRLLVVNFGNGGIPAPQDDRVLDGVTRVLHAGAGLLGLHTASTLFPRSPAWPALLGGRWVRGTSMHPQQARFRVHVADAPLTAGLNDFDTIDEAYSLLAVEPASTVVARHDEHGAGQPLWWHGEHRGIRFAYDALGHDAVAYEAEPQQRFVAHAALWAASSTRADARQHPRSETE